MSRLTYFLADFSSYLIFSFTITVIAFSLLIFFKKSNLLLALISAVLTLIYSLSAGEVYFRYIYDSSDGLGFLKVSQKWHERHVVYNGDFRRDKEFTTAKRPGEFRIAVIGDSITFGYGIKNPQDRYSDLLTTKLKQDGFDVSVYNLGISGQGSHEEISGFRHLAYLDFDLLIWQYYLNDAQTSANSAQAFVLDQSWKKFQPSPLIKFFTDRSFFLDFLYWRFSTRYNQTFRDLNQAYLKLYDDPNEFPRHQAEVAEFLTELKLKKTPVIVVIFPIMAEASIEAQAKKYYQQVKQMFAQRGVSKVIDLTVPFSQYPLSQLTVGRFDNHPNLLGHQIAAQMLYQPIKQYVAR